MSITISWCEVCNDGSLEGDPPFSYCRKCGFSFHTHCAVECNEDAEDDEDDEDDDGEVSSERCPKCQGEHIDPHSKGFAEGYCKALTASNVRVLTLELAKPLLNLEEHTGIILDLPTICEFEDLVASQLSQKKFRLRTIVEDERLENITERLTTGIIEEAISSYLGGEESIDLTGPYQATKGALDLLKKSIYRVQLGISFDWEDMMEEKLTVEDVEESSLAETLGILPGDIIVKVNGAKVDIDHLAEGGYPFGDPFLAEHTLSISREGELLDIAIGEDHAERPHIKLDVILNEDNVEELFSKHKGALTLNGLTELSDAAAQSLSKHEGELHLNGLRELSDAAAESLSKHEGELHLNGLRELSDSAAESLSKLEGELSLDGLTELSNSAAESLSKHEGNLFLDSLTELSNSAAESLSKHEGEELTLNGLTELSDAAAESLSKIEGDLYLNGLTELSDAAAESLSKHKGGLLLNGLTELSDAAAESLSKHDGELYLGGLTELSDAAAESLSKHEGALLALWGLTELSDAAAESLSKHDGELYLDRLRELSDAAAEFLSEHL